MKTYKIHFEFYGKKRKTTVKANSVNEAKEIVRNNINFLKIVYEDPIDYLKNMFGI